MVISIPSYYAKKQIDAIADSAKIARLHIQKMVYDHEAVAAAYAFSKRGVKSDYNMKFNDPVNVCFVDVGLAYSSVFLINYHYKSG